MRITIRVHYVCPNLMHVIRKTLPYRELWLWLYCMGKESIEFIMALKRTSKKFASACAANAEIFMVKADIVTTLGNKAVQSYLQYSESGWTVKCGTGWKLSITLKWIQDKYIFWVLFATLDINKVETLATILHIWNLISTKWQTWVLLWQVECRLQFYLCLSILGFIEIYSSSFENCKRR